MSATTATAPTTIHTPIRGATFDPIRDAERLARQQRVVWQYCWQRGWVTLEEIRLGTGEPEASCSARLRGFRDLPGVTVEGRIRAGTNRRWEYRVTWAAPAPCKPQLEFAL